MKIFMISLLTVLLVAGCCQRAEAMSNNFVKTQVICKEGYKFLIVWNHLRHALPSSPVVVQIFGYSEIDEVTSPQPVPCTKKLKEKNK